MRFLKTSRPKIAKLRGVVKRKRNEMRVFFINFGIVGKMSNVINFGFMGKMGSFY